jgi:hypothetical protein
MLFVARTYNYKSHTSCAIFLRKEQTLRLLDAAQGTALLLAQQDSAVVKERNKCGSGTVTEDYSMGLHIFAIFLILARGTCAASFPLLAKTFSSLTVSQHPLFISRHLETGVMIAFAFAHLLPSAFENLWNECLPYFWTEIYDAAPCFIAMVAALSVIMVEMGFSIHGIRPIHYDAVAAGKGCPPHRDGYVTNQSVNGLAVERSNQPGQASFIPPDIVTLHHTVGDKSGH